jgi:hypothetical protein
MNSEYWGVVEWVGGARWSGRGMPVLGGAQESV